MWEQAPGFPLVALSTSSAQAKRSISDRAQNRLSLAAGLPSGGEGAGAAPSHVDRRLLLALAVVLDVHSGPMRDAVVVVGLVVAAADRRDDVRADLRLLGADAGVLALAGV